MGTKQQYRLKLYVDGIDCGEWDKKTGGDVSATITKHRPGGMSPQKVYGGPVDVSNIVVTRVKERQDRDDLGLARWLETRVGKGNCTYIEIPLDGDGNVYGTGPTRTGKLERVSGADIDSDSSDLDMYEVEIAPNGNV